VLDASMALAWLFVDEGTAATDEVLRRVVIEGGIVPSLWRLEVANALQIAVRRGRCDEAYVDRSLQYLAELPIATDDETNAHAWGHHKDSRERTRPNFVRCGIPGTRVTASKPVGILRCRFDQGRQSMWLRRLVGLI
jgi:hypothetical protein